MVLQPIFYEGPLTSEKRLLDRSRQVFAVARRCDGDLYVTAGALDDGVLTKLVLENILDDGVVFLRPSGSFRLDALEEAGIEEGRLRKSRNGKTESETVE